MTQKVHFGRFSTGHAYFFYRSILSVTLLMSRSKHLTRPDDVLQSGSENLIKSFREYGCAFLRDPSAMEQELSIGRFAPYVAGMNFCAEFGVFFPVRPFSSVCPVACGCHSGDPHCPHSCPVRDKQLDPICPAYQKGQIATLFLEGQHPLGECPITM